MRLPRLRGVLSSSPSINHRKTKRNANVAKSLSPALVAATNKTNNNIIIHMLPGQEIIDSLGKWGGS